MNIFSIYVYENLSVATKKSLSFNYPPSTDQNKQHRPKATCAADSSKNWSEEIRLST